MSKIIAIGGGKNGRVLPNGSKKEYETFAIDKEIVSLSKDNDVTGVCEKSISAKLFISPST